VIFVVAFLWSLNGWVHSVDTGTACFLRFEKQHTATTAKYCQSRVGLQAVAHGVAAHLPASAYIDVRWQPVPPLAARFHFSDRYSRFHLQTQFLFASRRSRTPRGAFLQRSARVSTLVRACTSSHACLPLNQLNRRRYDVIRPLLAGPSSLVGSAPGNWSGPWGKAISRDCISPALLMVRKISRRHTW
jgi:hypothetical protein